MTLLLPDTVAKTKLLKYTSMGIKCNLKTNHSLITYYIVLHMRLSPPNKNNLSNIKQNIVLNLCSGFKYLQSLY